ncbi:MAG: EF-P lysine aminoacylase GenX [Deltaproteobacteria bacterium]|nr:MAG: EF-P lysine aminoacylase GenX [Deltaproteobacteria bacterium]
MSERNWQLARKRPRLELRARILQQVRAFFVGRGLLEVETPCRIPANAPELHIDAVEAAGAVLQSSPELAMKRLLAAGYPDLFQLARVWRDGERGRRHLPEFTLLEWYRRDADYTALMGDCEALLGHLVPGGRLAWGGAELDLSPPWPRLSVDEAFRRHAACPVDEALATGRFDEILTDEVEPRLGPGPLFLVDYPAPLAALARLKPANPAVAERVELYLGGLELANGFSELTDPVEQRARFTADEAARRAAGKPPRPLPEPYLADLSALPPCAGIALGLDRLVMLLAGAAEIGEVVAFTPEQL